ncbi:MAG: hypothetical protein ABI425_02890 [Patescibacteria group bacterium]
MTNQFFSSILRKIRKLTLIEMLIILIVAVAILFSLFWFSRSKKQVIIDLVAQSSYYPGGPPPQYWLTNSIHEQDKIYNEFGKLVGTVNKVQNVDYGGEFRYLRVSVGIDALLNSRTQLYSYGNQRLRIGDNLTLTIKNVKFTGLIQRIHNSEDQNIVSKKKFRLKLFMRNVPIWLLKTYDDSFTVYDEKNNQIFQIVKVLSVKPSTEEVAKVEGGTMQFVESDLHRNIETEVQLTANCELGVCYFNEDQPIKIGMQVWAQTEKSSVSYAIITEILEEKEL